MNCLTEALGLSLPGNGTILATHANRRRLFEDAAKLIVGNAYKYYEDGDESVLPRSIATRQAFLNAMTLDIAMGGSTNTVLHLLAVANEAGVDFKMADIDALSRKVPCLCKLSPNTQRFSIQECNRAGGVMGILGELAKGDLLDLSAIRVNGQTLGEDVKKYDITGNEIDPDADRIYHSAPAGRFCTQMGAQDTKWEMLDTDRTEGCIHDLAHAYSKDGGLAVLFGNIAQDGCVVKRQALTLRSTILKAQPKCSTLRRLPAKASWAERSLLATWWSSPMKDRRVARACKKCSTPLPTSKAGTWEKPAH